MGMLPGALPVRLAAGPPRRDSLSRRSIVRRVRAVAATSAPQSQRSASIASAAVLTLEAVGSLMMWAPIPLAWMWVGGRVYAATGSLAADGGVAFLGFMATTYRVMAGLNRLDRTWVALRRRAGHDQKDGALTQVVVVSATLGIIAFLLWYYVLEQAYVLPFMPSQ
jgi:hypothetical protein